MSNKSFPKGMRNKMQHVKVVKFGGSSLADAEQFRKVANIVLSDPERRYVVASAPGKRFPEDEKVTDLFYACYKAIGNEEEFEQIFKKITDRYDGIIEGLGLDLSLESEYEAIRYAIQAKAGRDYAASRGEYLNSIILAKYLGYDFINAADVIFFDESGKYDAVTTEETFSQCLKYHERAVIPGFYGSMPNDTIKTFSRGGSDVTGAIVAGVVRAEIYENWTDVSGFLVADPRIVKDPPAIQVISYRELRELSYMGAGVLHEDSIFPVRKAHIPINIRNTNRPNDPGTFIVSDKSKYPDAEKTVVTGIAGKKGFSIINIEKDSMNNEVGFGRRVLTVLEENNISFEHLPSGIYTMSVVFPTAALENCKNDLLEEMKKEVEPDFIEMHHGYSLIAVVGSGMVKAKGTAAKVFEAIHKMGVNVKMIDQGSDEMNIIIGVEDGDFESTICGLFEAFFSKKK